MLNYGIYQMKWMIAMFLMFSLFIFFFTSLEWDDTLYCCLLLPEQLFLEIGL